MSEARRQDDLDMTYPADGEGRGRLPTSRDTQTLVLVSILSHKCSYRKKPFQLQNRPSISVHPASACRPEP